MDKHALWKWLILVVLLAGSLVLVTPPKEKIRPKNTGAVVYGVMKVGKQRMAVY